MDTIQDVLPPVSDTNTERIIPLNYCDDHIWPAELEALVKSNQHAVKLIVNGPTCACWNCGGSGLMFVYVWVRGPFQTPNGRVKYLEGEGVAVPGWYQGEMHTAPCPRCQGDAWREYLRSNCGLKGNDLDVSLEMFRVRGVHKAKEYPLSIARSLLAMNAYPSGFITYYGETGRGKSHLLKSLVNGFRGIGVFSQYINATDMLEGIKERFSDSQGQIAVEEVIRHYKRVQVLAIDELDKVNLTNWTKQTLHRLLDSRYEDSGLLTVLAMQMHPDRLSDDLDYLRSRIIGGTPVEVAGEDMRPYLKVKLTQEPITYDKD